MERHAPSIVQIDLAHGTAISARRGAGTEQAQRALAADVTRRVHGDKALGAAEEVSGLLFGGADPKSLSRDALVALEGDRERLAHLQLAAEAAGNASLLARQRYSTGLVDFQTVLDTQRTQLTTQEGVANASTDLGSDHVRLYKALGGGWEAHVVTSAARPITKVRNMHHARWSKKA